MSLFCRLSRPFPLGEFWPHREILVGSAEMSSALPSPYPSKVSSRFPPDVVSPVGNNSAMRLSVTGPSWFVCGSKMDPTVSESRPARTGLGSFGSDGNAAMSEDGRINSSERA